MTDSPTDFRVLWQRFGRLEDGPTFGFTTVLDVTPEAAAEQLRAARANDENFSIVQVVEANDIVTGFTYADVIAARSDVEDENVRRRSMIGQIVELANAEAAGTLNPRFGDGWTELVDGWRQAAYLSLLATGIVDDRAHQGEEKSD